MASMDRDIIGPEEVSYDPHNGGEDSMVTDNDFSFLMPEHPALERVQIALRKQLSTELEKITLDLKEKEEALRRVSREKDDVGIQMFSVQQQLVKLQAGLESAYDEIQACKKRRNDSEEKLAHVQKIYEHKKVDLETNFKRMQRINDELNQLNITVRQVEDYNDSMKSEIQITRRGTYKAESMIQDIEKQKTKQDFLVDKLNEDIRTLTETKALYEAQYLAQKQETEAALATMAEAQREIASVEEEMSNMRAAWKKLLMDIKFRDDMLTTMNEEVLKLEEKELNVDSEIRGIKLATKQAQDELERLTELAARNAKETEELAVKAKTMQAESERWREQSQMFRSSMAHTQNEVARAEQSIAALEQQRANYDVAGQQCTAATVKLKESMFDMLSSQKTMDKSTDNTTKAARKQHDQAQKLEMELLELKNEIARVEVDVLNITAHNHLLKERLGQLSGELAEQERLVDEHEQDIDKRHHDIEKRQLKVDRLNREYDEKKRANSAGGEGAGPLEAEHANLRRQLNNLVQEQGRLQNEWTAKQTSLIELQQKLQECQTKTEAANHHLIVMQQRRLRLEADLSEKNGDVESLTKESKQVQSELDKLNPLVFELQAKLTQLSRDVELERRTADGDVRAMEAEVANIDAKLLTIKEEKKNLRDNLAEAERQVMLWERRILLEREVTEALDPTVGQVEMATMRKEIHRMELREEKLKRQKDELVMEMERVISKKDSIELKFAASKKKALNATPKVAGGRNALKRKIQSLDQQIEALQQSIDDADNQLLQQEEELIETREQVTTGTHEVNSLTSNLAVVESSLLQKRALRLRSNADIIRFRRAASIFAQNAVPSAQDDNGGAADAADLAALEGIIDQELSVAERIQQAIHVVYEQHPHLDAPLNIFLEWATTIARAIGGGQAPAEEEVAMEEQVKEIEAAVEQMVSVGGKKDPLNDTAVRSEKDEDDMVGTMLVQGGAGDAGSNVGEDEDEGLQTRQA